MQSVAELEWPVCDGCRLPASQMICCSEELLIKFRQHQDTNRCRCWLGIGELFCTFNDANSPPNKFARPGVAGICAWSGCRELLSSSPSGSCFIVVSEPDSTPNVVKMPVSPNAQWSSAEKYVSGPCLKFRDFKQVLYAKGPQSQTRGAMILQAYLHPEAAAATAASNAQGTRDYSCHSFRVEHTCRNPQCWIAAFSWQLRVCHSLAVAIVILVW